MHIEQSAIYIEQIDICFERWSISWINVPNHGPVISSVIQVTKPVQKAAYKL